MHTWNSGKLIVNHQKLAQVPDQTLPREKHNKNYASRQRKIGEFLEIKGHPTTSKSTTTSLEN